MPISLEVRIWKAVIFLIAWSSSQHLPVAPLIFCLFFISFCCAGSQQKRNVKEDAFIVEQGKPLMGRELLSLNSSLAKLLARVPRTECHLPEKYFLSLKA